MHIIRFIHIPMLYNDPWVMYGTFAILSVFSLLVSKVDFPAKIKALLNGYGEISYSTYLFHNLFIGSAVLIEKQMDFYGSDTRAWLFVLCFALVCTTVSAMLSYRFIEKPFITYGHKLSRSFLNKPAKATTQA
jgi:peptidoglycan/LPS O-acetylase OafA/YrhL